MLTTRDWQGAPLRAIVLGEFTPFAGRARIQGPDLMIGPRMARALFASAESFDGIYAEKINLVQYTVDSEAGLTSMMEHLSDLAMGAAPGAVADAKALVRFLVDDTTRPRTLVPQSVVPHHVIDEHVMKETARRIAKRRASSEGREGLKAFLEKRKPEWNS